MPKKNSFGVQEITMPGSQTLYAVVDDGDGTAVGHFANEYEAHRQAKSYNQSGGPTRRPPPYGTGK